MDMNSAFYDVMFGNPPEEIGQLNEIEDYVYKKMLDCLEKQTELAPLVPVSKDADIVQDLEIQLRMDSPDMESIADLVRLDPLFVGEVFRKLGDLGSSGKIHTIGDALNTIGVAAIADIISEQTNKPVTEVKPIYYKRYGRLVWRHGLEVAHACAMIANEYQQDPETCYLMGLMHDMGKVIVYLTLIDAYAEANPDASPGSVLFRRMMEHNSTLMSAMMARHWHLPEQIITAITNQQSAEAGTLADILHKGNLCSDVHLLIRSKKLDMPGGFEILQAADLPLPLIDSALSSLSELNF